MLLLIFLDKFFLNEVNVVNWLVLYLLYGIMNVGVLNLIILIFLFKLGFFICIVLLWIRFGIIEL